MRMLHLDKMIPIKAKINAIAKRTVNRLSFKLYRFTYTRAFFWF